MREAALLGFWKYVPVRLFKIKQALELQEPGTGRPYPHFMQLRNLINNVIVLYVKFYIICLPPQKRSVIFLSLLFLHENILLMAKISQITSMIDNTEYFIFGKDIETNFELFKQNFLKKVIDASLFYYLKFKQFEFFGVSIIHCAFVLRILRQ